MSDIPPKQTVTGTAAARVDVGYDLPQPAMDAPSAATGATSGSSGELVSIHAAALQASGDSFPVLKAFQDYLETERQRARKRLVLLSSFFVALMALVVAGFLVAGIMIFGHMQRMQSALLQAAIRPTPAAAPAPAAIAPVEPPPAAPLPAAIGEELKRLRESLNSLRTDNERLRDRLTVAPPPAAAAPVAAAAPAAPATPTAPAAAPAVVAPAATAPAAVATATVAPAPTAPHRPPLEIPKTPIRARTPDGFADSVLYIPVKGQEDQAPWRLLLPTR
ncbi:MAG: hypothetical protein PHR35_05495 [Kiritimatiellae bacterium]|nr:hypothetical protein [Kiritimatiellia bacterium]